MRTENLSSRATRNINSWASHSALSKREARSGSTPHAAMNQLAEKGGAWRSSKQQATSPPLVNTCIDASRARASGEQQTAKGTGSKALLSLPARQASLCDRHANAIKNARETGTRRSCGRSTLGGVHIAQSRPFRCEWGRLGTKKTAMRHQLEWKAWGFECLGEG